MDFRTTISATELAEDRRNDAFAILDCRFDLMNPEAGRQAWIAGHIPGAVHVDLDRDLSGPVTPDSGRHPLPSPGTLIERFGSFGIGRTTQVVCYDHANGAIAARAWWLLRWLGHERVALLDGGYAAWVAAGSAVQAGQETNQPRRFVGEPAEHRAMSTDEVVEAGNDVASLRLVDAREAVRFRGEEEPIDTVAGHIPGARNLHFGATLQENGTLRSPDELRVLFGNVLDNDLETPWSVMCGSGVTACQLVVAAEHAGLRPPRVYVGSFSEWIRDSGRPVATGPD